MKIEPHDHAPKPLTKRFRDVKPGEFFRWDGRTYRFETFGVVLCIDNLQRYTWVHEADIEREVVMLDAPIEERWRELTKDCFPTKMVEPETVAISSMKPGQPFILPIEFHGVLNGRFVCGDYGSITRLIDGKVFTNMGDCRGIPINGKFVEEDATDG